MKLVCVALLFASLSFGTLGENENSLEKEMGMVPQPKLEIREHRSGRISQIQGGRFSLREYSDTRGIVFGLAWNGGTPDLKALLGNYFQEYSEAKNKTRLKPGSRRLRVETSAMVVEHFGSVRNLQGRAFIRQLLPQGFHETDIQ
jgi:Protein of unknown function (DUF2844)